RFPAWDAGIPVTGNYTPADRGWYSAFNLGTRASGRCGGAAIGLAIVRLSGHSGMVGRWGRWLSGQEQYGQDGPQRGHAAGDEGADGEAAQEGVGGGVMQRQSQGRMAEGRDLAGGHVRGADGLVCDRRDRG